MTQSSYSIEQLDILFKNSRDSVFYMKKVGDDYQYIYTNMAAHKLINGDMIGQDGSAICKIRACQKYYALL